MKAFRLGDAGGEHLEHSRWAEPAGQRVISLVALCGAAEAHRPTFRLGQPPLTGLPGDTTAGTWWFLVFALKGLQFLHNFTARRVFLFFPWCLCGCYLGFVALFRLGGDDLLRLFSCRTVKRNVHIFFGLQQVQDHLNIAFPGYKTHIHILKQMQLYA